MSLVTLSFLITTPESWVPNLGDSEHGFTSAQRPGPIGDQGYHHARCRMADHGRFRRLLFAKETKRMSSPGTLPAVIDTWPGPTKMKIEEKMAIVQSS